MLIEKRGLKLSGLQKLDPLSWYLHFLFKKAGKFTLPTGLKSLTWVRVNPAKENLSEFRTI